MTFFKNPMADFNAPDPFMTYDNVTGYYYALFTCGKRLEIFRSRRASDILKNGDSRVIYTVNGEKDGIWGDIWAPEMHKGTDGRWYIYTSGRIEDDGWEKRLFIMKADTEDPFGTWSFAGFPIPNRFAIDPTVYTAKDGKQYICYSTFFEDKGQVLEICDLKNPTTFGEERAMIATAELDWELVVPYINNYAIVEGAFFVESGERLFIIYSANGCWSDDYCLGLLEYTGGGLCRSESWKKHPKPIFVKGNGVYGPGHASFFKSPDNSEIWCAYHTLAEHNENATPTNRYFNIQKIEFDESGFPIASMAVGWEREIESPSGEQ